MILTPPSWRDPSLLPQSLRLMATPPPATPFLAVNSSSSNTPLSTFHYKITEKLDDKNYLVWLLQIEQVLRAHRLHRYCVASDIPPQFLSEADRLSNTENPAYTAWELQDQLLLSWLHSSLSSSFLPCVIGCRHTFQLWERIHTNFQSKTKAKVRQLRAELRTTKKGTSTVAEFLAKIQLISDSLTSIGESVTPNNQIDVILEGLPSEFESIVTLINSKADWFDLDEVKALLLAQEQRVEKQRVTDEVATLNLTQTQKNNDEQGNNSKSIAQAHYMNPNTSDATQNSGQ